MTPRLTACRQPGQNGEVSDRLAQQITFLIEIDRLKNVLRQTPLTDGSRRENSAEHSWHVAMAVCLLAEHAAAPVDTARAVKMALVHDLIEIDAGDTFCYDGAANLDKADRERLAAERLFALLPDEQRDELRALWEDFERMESPEARLANACDRLLPLLANRAAGGGSWSAHAVREPQVRHRMRPVADGLPAAQPLVDLVIDEAVSKGFLAR